jgi:hypothetical protein
MSISISVNYGNGANKAFVIDEPPEPLGSVLSLWDILGLAKAIPPGLSYNFTDGTPASDRGGLSFVGKVVAVDGLDGDWSVFINDEQQTGLRVAEHRMAEHREEPTVKDGDTILLSRGY